MTGAAARRRSAFVSVVAWLAIVSGMMTTLYSALGTIAGARPMLLGSLVGGLAAIVTGVGLRRRREWARRAFLVVLAYASLSSFAAVPLVRYRLERQLASGPRGAPPPPITHEQVNQVAANLASIQLFWAVAFTLVGGLFFWRLCTRAVREEFDAGD